MENYRIVVYKNGLYVGNVDTIWAERDWSYRKSCNKEGLLAGEYYTIEKWKRKFLGGEWIYFGGKFENLADATTYFKSMNFKGPGTYDDMP